MMFGGLLSVESCKPRKKTTQSADNLRKDEFEAYFIDAVTHFNNANYGMSIKLFNKCVSINPIEAAPYYYISRIKFEEKSPIDEGLQFAMKAYNLAPSNKVYAQWYASKLKQAGKTDAAIEVLEKIIAINPKDEILVADLDVLYSKNGSTDKRIQLWSKLMENKGFSIKYASKLIELYKAKNDFEAAHNMYEQIQKAAPMKYKYLVDDGNLYLNEKKLNEAINKYNQALKINPNIWEINYMLYTYYTQQKDSAKALHYFNQGLNDPSATFQSKAVLISEIKTKSQSDSTMKPFLMVIGNALRDLYSASADANKITGYCFEYNGKLNEALKYYHLSVNITPSFDAFAGWIRTSEKIYGAAATLHLVDSALEYYPNHPEFYITGAEIAIRANQFKKAIELAESGQSFTIIQDQKAQLIYLHIQALLLSGDIKNAREVCESQMTIIGDNPLLLESMGDVYFAMKNKTEALVYWKKALDKGGDNVRLNRKLNDEIQNK